MTGEHLQQVIQSFGRGTLVTSDVGDYFDVVRDAYNVHLDREEIRCGLWKEYTAMDQVNTMRLKVDRVVRSLERLEIMRNGDQDGLAELIEQLTFSTASELHDIINYANFAVRQLG